ncbi:MAG: hypothetical protein ACE5FM_09150, partial [Methyloligellaceae bacterium]
ALSVDEEAYFDGTSQRVNDPLGLGEVELKPSTSSAAKPAGSNSKPEKGSGEKLQPLPASTAQGRPATQGH